MRFPTIYRHTGYLKNLPSNKNRTYATIIIFSEDTSEVDEKQGEINNALDDAADNICADVGKNLSPDENEEFSQQIDAPPLSTEWASIIEATLVNVEKGLCNSIEVVALEREDDVYTELGSMEAPQSVGDVRKTEYSLLFVYLVCSLISLFFLL